MSLPNVLPNVLVYGLGRSGLGVVRHLKRLGWHGAWCDAAPEPVGADEALGAGFERITDPEKAIASGAYTLMIAAPGVMMHHKDVQLAKRLGVRVIGEAELCYQTLPTPLIGVTGTAGKGSTTALIATILRAHGLSAREGGNFDPPLLDVAPTSDVVVVELSSFQLERIESFRVPVAVITNLGVDHVTDHGSLVAYHNAKLRILENLLPGDAVFVPASLVLPKNTNATVHAVAETGNVCRKDGTLVFEAAQTPAQHHPSNLRLAVRASEAYLQHLHLELDPATTRAALHAFAGIKGRFETVAVVQNTRFIDDSIATRALAVQAALENAPAPIAWVLGGRDKLSLTEKASELPKLQTLVREKVKVILAIGESGLSFAAFFPDTPVLDLSHLSGETAMLEAARLGLQHAAGGSVLLAPLGTSFDQFKNYRERGDAFARAALALLSHENPAQQTP